MSIKAIETSYAGHLFRSRLEARWAVFFDAMRIKWHYEEEGYELPSGRYLPDFRLEGAAVSGKADLWVEVKGKLEHAEFVNLVRAAVELPSNHRGATSPQVLVLGEVPDPNEPAVHARIDAHPEGFALQWVHFRAIAKRVVTSPVGDPDVFPVRDLNAWTAEGTEFIRESMTANICDYHLRQSVHLSAGYRAARSARFEHGQVGAML